MKKEVEELALVEWFDRVKCAWRIGDNLPSPCRSFLFRGPAKNLYPAAVSHRLPTVVGLDFNLPGNQGVQPSVPRPRLTGVFGLAGQEVTWEVGWIRIQYPLMINQSAAES